MAIEHDVIPDGERHEPKGLSGAGVDTVYVADGGGADTGSWAVPPVSGFGTALDHQALHKEGGNYGWKYPAGVVYAEMDIINNSTTDTITYTSTTPRLTWLNNAANYKQMTGVPYPFAAPIADYVTFDSATDEFVVQVAGDYKVDFWGSFLCTSANTFIGIKYGVDTGAGVGLSPQKLTGQAQSAADVINLSAAGIVEGLTVGDRISMHIGVWRGTGSSTTVTFEDGGMTLTLLHEA